MATKEQQEIYRENENHDRIHRIFESSQLAIFTINHRVWTIGGGVYAINVAMKW